MTMPPDVTPSPEFWTNAGLFLAAIAAAIWAYLKQPRKPEPTTPSPAAIASVGMEFGTREQMRDLVTAVNRVADIMEGKKQAGMEDKLSRLIEKVDELEEIKRQGR